jgi:hypothetical protein
MDRHHAQSILFFDFIDFMIRFIFVYRVYKKKQSGVQIGLSGEDLEEHIYEIFVDYPIYKFIKNIIADIADISSRSYVKPLSGLERQQIIANIFLEEKKNKYTDTQLALFSLFEVIKGIAHIYGREDEEQLIKYSEVVANGIEYCIGCHSIPTNRCKDCLQIVYCSLCLNLKHNCRY